MLIIEGGGGSFIGGAPIDNVGRGVDKVVSLGFGNDERLVAREEDDLSGHANAIPVW